MKRLFSILFGVALGCAWVVGCVGPSDPSQDDTVIFVYTPKLQALEITIPETLNFSVTSNHSGSIIGSWTLNGQEVATGDSYNFVPESVGDFTLVVTTGIAENLRRHEWLVTVQPSTNLLPPPVYNVSIGDGPQPMDVEVNWFYISHPHFPITDYLIASSYLGEVTGDNWDEATQLGSFAPVPENLFGSANFTAAEHGMLPGATIWFGVRGRDDHGQLSPLEVSYQHTISFSWWVEGTVYGSNQSPLPEIIIDYGCSSCRVNTDGEGRYRIGPFRNLDSVTVYTRSDDDPLTGWYDFQAEPFVYNENGNTHDIQLVNRFGIDDLCLGYDGEFLTFFQQMTKTNMISDLRPNLRLYKWAEYPVPVYIPDYVRESDGLDFGENSRTAMVYWNLVMNEDYLVEVADPAQARIEFYFADLGSGVNGRTSLVAPNNLEYNLGDVIPEKVLIGIHSEEAASYPLRLQETSMHELGHALGLIKHVQSCVNAVPYLMNYYSLGFWDGNYENAVHVDEQRMVRAIRYLPQGVDMASFRLN